MNPHACPSATPDGATKRASLSGLASPQRALWLAGEHLRHAGLSHARACALQAQGLAHEALSQSRMTEVFLNNAIHHLQTQTGQAFSSSGGRSCKEA